MEQAQRDAAEDAPGSAPPARIAFGSTTAERQFDEYLQDRLRILAGVITVATGTLYVVFRLLNLLYRGPDMHWIECFVQPSTLVHAGSVLLAAAIWGLLRRRAYGGRALRGFDAALLFLTIATCVAIYAIEYRGGMAQMDAVLASFLIARAVVVPSRAWTTVLLSLPAPLGMLAVQASHGAWYPVEGLAVTGPDYTIGILVVDQVVLLLAVGIAGVASAVNFSLRTQVEKARRLGQYRLEERIGRGSMGEVYRATHAMLRRPTAIKLVRPEQAGEETLARFEREVRETSRLSHPNTILIHDYGRTPDGVFYYAMEYLDGADLKEIVTRTGPMPAGRVIAALEQACASLHEAHTLGLVHRDVKPGNLVLCSRGGAEDVLKVVDFGLVKDLRETDASLTRLGDLCGTPETMAPEVLSGETAGPPADLYAVAAVGYWCLTGVPVFDARTVPEFLAAHLNEAPVPPGERVPGVPPDLERLLLDGLAKEPAGRPPSAAAFRERLLACRDAHAWTQREAQAWWRRYRADGGGAAPAA